MIVHLSVFTGEFSLTLLVLLRLILSLILYLVETNANGNHKPNIDARRNSEIVLPSAHSSYTYSLLISNDLIGIHYLPGDMSQLGAIEYDVGSPTPHVTAEFEVGPTAINVLEVRG